MYYTFLILCTLEAAKRYYRKEEGETHFESKITLHVNIDRNVANMLNAIYVLHHHSSLVRSEKSALLHLKNATWRSPPKQSGGR